MAAYSMNGPSDHFPGKPGFRWKPSVHSLCRPQESHPVWSFPQKHRSRSRRTSTAARVTPWVTRDTLPDISSTQPRAQSHADIGAPVGIPAGNHSRSRLKPSPISDRHVIELVVRSLEALRLRTSGYVYSLSRRTCLADHPWSLSPGRRTKHPVTARSLTSLRGLAHLSSPQLGPPLSRSAQVWGRTSPFH